MPNLWGVTMVKDEADVIEATLRHVAAQGVAGILVADNGSTDGTEEILNDLDLDVPLVIVDDPEVGYWQSTKMTNLAQLAHLDHGADWVLPFDADEIWWHISGHPLADVLHAADGHIVTAALYNHYTTSIDPAGEPVIFDRMPYRMPTPQPLGKVMVKMAPGVVIDAGNHSAQHVGGWQSSLAGMRVAHFPYRSEDQFVRKAINGAAAYAATDLPWETGMHWREYGLHYQNGGEAALREIFRTYFYYDSPTTAGLVWDPVKL